MPGRSWHSAADLMRCRALRLPGTLRSDEFAAILNENDAVDVVHLGRERREA
jgi:hypothetical protein